MTRTIDQGNVVDFPRARVARPVARFDADVVGVIHRPSIVVTAPSGFVAAPLVELHVEGHCVNLTVEQADALAQFLISATLQAGTK
ncbi:hypothetical protein LPW26_06005 [Rhodopseudomonas sp. HC1]|uniref:hypothetical protein n=1 Tax=Rhodopseudomonas infernalis TaxID=2897386 RepID=UPI001EE904FB|nr:hypothetical protein [Rhodopseudomonas infernalis]MCG6204180.1 hypothetical protein [Rhodopseudomonas infernalis]